VAYPLLFLCSARSGEQMPKEISPKNDRESSFVQLLSQADEIRVREVPEPAKQVVYSSVDKVLEEFEKDTNGVEYRSFVVQVKKHRQPVTASKAPSISQDREYLLRNAGVLLENSELLLARHIYSYLLKENIRDKEALSGLGQCLLRLAESQAAKKCFRAIWELYQDEEAAVYLGQCLSNEGEELPALEILRKINSPQNLKLSLRFDYHKLRGNIETRLGLFEEANHHYQHALALQPSSDIVYVNLGTLELQRQNADLAEMYFERAVEINPANAKASCGLGLTLMTRHDFEGAKNRFIETLEKDPYHVVALAQLFCLAQAMDDHRFFRPRLLKFLETYPNHIDGHYWHAACLYRERKWNECEKVVDRVLELNKSHFQAQKLKESLTQNRHHG
jgi:tetratricopeptide (TPR) repeat protein